MTNRNDRRFLEQIGFRIREKRLEMKMTQADLGRAAELHRTFIGSVERGERNVALLSLRRIAQALRTSVVELLAEQPKE